MTRYPTGATIADNIPGVETAELIQTGGQKAVYRATRGGSVFALKMIALKADDVSVEEPNIDISGAEARVHREVEILEQVDVPVLAKGGPLGLSKVEIGADTWLFFSEEWIEGNGLADMIREGRLQPSQVVQLGNDLVQAACWLAQRDMIHRDIKPANIIWATDRSRFVLLDPGIAFDLQGASLTSAPIVVGTIPYLSPEQMEHTRRRTLDFRSDLFAIGVVLYEAATAEHPFVARGSTATEVLAGILTKTPPALAYRIDGFPQLLSNLIDRLIAKSPHLRYRTCERAQAAIANAAASMGVSV